MSRRWYPKARGPRAAWHSNVDKELPALAAKYNISAATLAEVAADNAWIQYWTQFRNDADLQSQALTRYYNTVGG